MWTGEEGEEKEAEVLVDFLFELWQRPFRHSLLVCLRWEIAVNRGLLVLKWGVGGLGVVTKSQVSIQGMSGHECWSRAWCVRWCVVTKASRVL